MIKLFRYLREYKKESIFAPVFKLLETVLELCVPLVVAAVIDTGIAGADRSYVAWMCILLLVMGAVGLCFSVTAQYFAAKAAVGFASGIRHALFSHIQGFSYSDLDSLGTSTLITRLTADVNQVQTGVNLTLRLLLRSPFVVIGAMVMAFCVDRSSAMIFVVLIPALAAVVFLIMFAGIPLYRRSQSKLDRVVTMTRENLSGARVLRAFVKERDQVRRFREKNQDLSKTQQSVGRITALLNPLTYVLVNAAVIALIQKGAIRVDTGLITQGALVALYNYTAQILTELIKLATLIINVTRAAACGDRIQAVLEYRPREAGEIFPVQGENVSESKCGAEHAEAAAGSGRSREQAETVAGGGNSAELARTAKEGESIFALTPASVEFRDVSLRYAGASEDALKEISFSAREGETIGIIGATGSGKTSLVNMIPCFYECDTGSVILGGREIRQYSPDKLRSQIGVVPQRPVLFRGTIRENLKWGSKDADDEGMLDALLTAQAKNMVTDMEGGLDALIEQGGANLSGGQRQRLAIARALVRKPRVLILDDAASALDYATEESFWQALSKMDDKPTVFAVSSRIGVMRYADRILLLDGGEIAAFGTHAELMKSSKLYREIYGSAGEVLAE